MRIIVWSINYAPELTGIAVYNTGMCEFLQRQGHEVEMVTGFAYYPAWKKSPEDSGIWYRKDHVNGVTVHRCRQYVPIQPRLFTRIVHEATFVWNSFWCVLALPRADVYVVVSPPLLLGLFAGIATWIKRSRYWFHVQDLQPDAAIRLGMMKPGLFTRALLWLEKIAYEKAVRVSAISPGLIQTLQDKGVPAEKTVYWPNWFSPVPAPVPTRAEARARLGFGPEVRLISYAGNLGIKQGLEVLLEAAALLRERKDLHFLIGGAGSARMHLEEKVKTQALTNVRFLGVLPEEEHTALLCASDVCVITQRHGTGTAFLPSKLLKILALGRAVVTNAEPGSALYTAIESGGFGMAVASEDAGVMARAITSMLKDEPRRTEAERLAKAYVEQFSADRVLRQWEEELKQCE
jgi:colanic acid biosynthesis glycosyl transferase WcaI